MPITVQNFHRVNCNCSSLEQSLRFFVGDLGLNPLEAGSPDVQDGRAIGLPKYSRWRTQLLGDHRGTGNTLLELREWIAPRYTGRPYVIPHHAGISRLSFQAPDVDLLYEHVRGNGHFCFSTPQKAQDDFREFFSDCYFCCRAPDALKLEFVQGDSKQLQIAWVDVNCSDIVRAVEWYEQHLGLQQTVPLRRFTMDGRFCGIKAPLDISMALLHLPGQQERFGLRFLQWHSPATRGKPYEMMSNLGLYQVALQVENIESCHEELRSAGVECRAAPLELATGIETRQREKVLFFGDPEGVCLQLIEGR